MENKNIFCYGENWINMNEVAGIELKQWLERGDLPDGIKFKFTMKSGAVLFICTTTKKEYNDLQSAINNARKWTI